MLETVLYADLGSAVTKLAARGKIEVQESRVALDPSDGSCVLAVGDKARRLLNAATVYPVRGGKPANIELCAIMLRRMALDMLNRKTLFGVSLCMLVPPSAPKMQRLAAAELAKAAGFKRVFFRDASAAGADGAGIDYSIPKATMIADLGRDKLSAAALANGGTLSHFACGLGSADFDRAIQCHFASEHGLLVGTKAAEQIKKSLYLPYLSAVGRSAEDGSPVRSAVKSREVLAALKPTYRAVAEELTKALDKTPPEAAADICDTGIVLIGSGALLCGLADELRAALGVPVRTAANAERAVIYGAPCGAGIPLAARERIKKPDLRGRAAEV